MKTFYAIVQFTDDRGVHRAGQPVSLPYTTDTEVANALSMLRYGVVSEQAPEGEVARPAPAPQEQALPVAPPGPMIETPGVVLPPPSDEVKDEEPKVETHDHAVETAGDEAEQHTAKDDPETPYFDARDEDGDFVKEGTPLTAPQKKATRRKR